MEEEILCYMYRLESGERAGGHRTEGTKEETLGKNSCYKSGCKFSERRGKVIQHAEEKNWPIGGGAGRQHERHSFLHWSPPPSFVHVHAEAQRFIGRWAFGISRNHFCLKPEKELGYRDNVVDA